MSQDDRQSASYFSEDVLMVEVKRLSPRREDVLALRLDYHPSRTEVLALSRAYARLNPEWQLLILLPGQSVECLREEEMNALGWYRKNGD